MVGTRTLLAISRKYYSPTGFFVLLLRAIMSIDPSPSLASRLLFRHGYFFGFGGVPGEKRGEFVDAFSQLR